MIHRALGRVAYVPTWRAMQAFNANRDARTADQLWLVEHPPVFTLGLAGRPEHLLAAGDIPVIPVDRGGQVTYHGPGQAVVYVLLDLKRAGLGVRETVRRMEEAVIDVLGASGLQGRRRDGMPGVYVDGAKIAAIGLRVARGCTYHGVSLNVDMDLDPFSRIDPCGYPALPVTRLADLGVGDNVDIAGRNLAHALQRHLIGIPPASHG